MHIVTINYHTRGMALAGFILVAASACRIYLNDAEAPAAKSVDRSGRSVIAVDDAWYNESDKLELTLSGVYGRKLVAVKLNEGNVALTGGQTGSLDFVFARSRASDAAESPSGIEAPKRPIPLPHQPSMQNPDGRSPSDSLHSARALTATVEIAEVPTLLQAAEVNDRADFWVDYKTESGSSAFTTVAARLAWVSPEAYFWVATGSGTSTSGVDSAFPMAELDAKKIELLADALSRLIKPKLKVVFGYEYGGAPSGVDPGGVDNDAHISILLYDIDFDYQEKQVHGTYGYFWGKDERPATVVTADTKANPPAYPSNGREIFYLDAPFLDDYPYAQVSTLAHEYQHMISYAVHEMVGRSGPSTWTNELRSLAAEDILDTAFEAEYPPHGFLGADDPGYVWADDGIHYRAQTFLYYYLETGLDNSDSFGLADYSMAYVFGAYLLRSYGGAPFLKLSSATGPSFGDLLHSIDETFANASTYRIHTQAYQPPVGIGSLGAFLEPFTLALFDIGANRATASSPLSRTDAPSILAAEGSGGAADFLRPLQIPANSLSILGYLYLNSENNLAPRAFSIHRALQAEPLRIDKVRIDIVKPASPGRLLLLFL